MKMIGTCLIILVFVGSLQLQAQTISNKTITAGEAPEWETYQYVLDASMLGMKKAAIFTGHIPSEEAGMEYCAQWMKTFIKEIPVIYLENGSAYNPVQNL